MAVILSAVSIMGCSRSTDNTPGEPTPGTSSPTSTSSSGEDKSDQKEKEPVVLEGWSAYAFDDSTGHTSYNDQMIWDVIEEKLGIRVNWTTVTTAGGNQNTQFGVLMASGELPDFFVDMSPTTLEQYGMKGALIDLTDYINKDMPDFQALLDKDPEAIGSITSADGKIYFFPRLLVEKELRCWCGTS